VRNLVFQSGRRATSLHVVGGSSLQCASSRARRTVSRLLCVSRLVQDAVAGASTDGLSLAAFARWWLFDWYDVEARGSNTSTQTFAINFHRTLACEDKGTLQFLRSPAVVASLRRVERSGMGVGRGQGANALPWILKFYIFLLHF